MPLPSTAFYVNTKGTGLNKDNVDRVFGYAQQFFTAPESAKKPYQIGSNNRGWTGMHNEILDPKSQRKGDFKEAFNIGEFDNGKPQQPLPDVFQDHVDEMYEFESLCRATCHKVLDLLGSGLEVDEDKYFSSRHKAPSGTTLRLLHYPAIANEVDYQPEVDIRAGAHSDYGSMTLLFSVLGNLG